MASGSTGPWARRRGLKRSNTWGWPKRSISVVAGARNHLQANRSLGFCFEILI
jgi:hypothetical protein